MIDQIIAYNKEFVAQKGYEKYLIGDFCFRLCYAKHYSGHLRIGR